MSLEHIASCRVFMAVPLPEALREGLGRVQERLRASGVRVRWTPIVNMHLSLLFLGDVDPSQFPDIIRVMDGAARGLSSFELQVESVGHFGSARSPRVVWAALKESPEALSILHQRLHQGILALGFDLEARPYQPHITLGRIRPVHGARALTSALSSFKNITHGSIRVTCLHLYESELRPEGTRYLNLHTTPLKGDT